MDELAFAFVHPAEPGRRGVAAISRRHFLRSAVAGATFVGYAAWLPSGCDEEEAGGAGADAAPGAGPDATPACLETEDNIEGPYYRAGAPLRANLVDAGVAGTALTVTGRVLGAGCGVALDGALVDVWQADADGVYDNQDPANPPGDDTWILRGRLYAGADGVYRFDTVVPGHYPIGGGQSRPAHIHVKVSAPGYAPLTTQLYLPDDPFLAGDPWARPSLLLPVADAPGGGKQATFDFVLRAA